MPRAAAGHQPLSTAARPPAAVAAVAVAGSLLRLRMPVAAQLASHCCPSKCLRPASRPRAKGTDGLHAWRHRPAHGTHAAAAAGGLEAAHSGCCCCRPGEARCNAGSARAIHMSNIAVRLAAHTAVPTYLPTCAHTHM